jgi:hypothetical protein
LCKQHNGEKAEKWPGEYYTDAELRRLAPLVGIDYKVLRGPPHYNPDAIELLKKSEFVEKLFERYARYTDELIELRNRILNAIGFDFFKSWPKISADLIKKADQAK